MSKPLDDNLELWNKVKQPPESALKEIKGGRLKGFTDINPMWRFEEMTRQFGQCGRGWFFSIKEQWSEDGADGTKAVFAIVDLYVSKGNDRDWANPIQGIGGSMLIQKETAGLRSNDEAYKMAVTDALGTAMKMLGFGADVYSGKWDGSKYINIESNESKITRKTMKEPRKIPSDLDKPILPPRDGFAKGEEEYLGMDEETKLHVNATASAIRTMYATGDTGMKLKAYQGHISGASNDFKMGLSFIMKNDSEIRRSLKQIGDNIRTQDVPQ